MKVLTTLAAAAAIGGALLTMVPAHAQEYPWCAQYGGRNGGRNCGFASYRQCMAAISGNGGFCERNLFFRGGPRYGAPYAQERFDRRWR